MTNKDISILFSLVSDFFLPEKTNKKADVDYISSFPIVVKGNQSIVIQFPPPSDTLHWDLTVIAHFTGDL